MHLPCFERRCFLIVTCTNRVWQQDLYMTRSGSFKGQNHWFIAPWLRIAAVWMKSCTYAPARLHEHAKEFPPRHNYHSKSHFIKCSHCQNLSILDCTLASEVRKSRSWQDFVYVFQWDKSREQVERPVRSMITSILQCQYGFGRSSVTIQLELSKCC